MSAAHNTGLVTVHENGGSNSYAIRGEDGNWLLALMHNGEAGLDKQRANLRHVAASWNACEGVTTEDLEQLGVCGLIGLTGLTEKYRQERDMALMLLGRVRSLLSIAQGQANTSVDSEFWDRVGAVTQQCDEAMALITSQDVDHVDPSDTLPAEAVAIGASLDSESLEQGEVL